MNWQTVFLTLCNDWAGESHSSPDPWAVALSAPLPLLYPKDEMGWDAGPWIATGSTFQLHVRVFVRRTGLYYLSAKVFEFQSSRVLVLEP